MAKTNSLRHALLSNKWLWTILALLLVSLPAQASEADLAIPDLWIHGSFDLPLVGKISAGLLLLVGSVVICGTLGFSLYLRTQIHKLPAHSSMLNVAETIFQTCKTYLIQQGKFLLMLFAFIAVAISYYLLSSGGNEGEAKPGAASIPPIVTVLLVLLF